MFQGSDLSKINKEMSGGGDRSEVGGRIGLGRGRTDDVEVELMM